MIIDERMTAFIDLMDRGNTPFLEELEAKALAEDIPIIRRSSQSLLRFLIKLSKPKRILEIGTAVGFSTLLMSEAAGKEVSIDTIESYEPRIEAARYNFTNAINLGECNAFDNKIRLLPGDATLILKELQGEYDMIFMDAAKGQYINWLPDLLRLLSKGGVLVSDNTLQDRDVLESRFAVTRRDRTIHARMREYIYELNHNECLETVVLPVGDGMCLSTKLK